MQQLDRKCRDQYPPHQKTLCPSLPFASPSHLSLCLTSSLPHCQLLSVSRSASLSPLFYSFSSRWISLSKQRHSRQNRWVWNVPTLRRWMTAVLDGILCVCVCVCVCACVCTIFSFPPQHFSVSSLCWHLCTHKISTVSPHLYFSLCSGTSSHLPLNWAIPCRCPIAQQREALTAAVTLSEGSSLPLKSRSQTPAISSVWTNNWAFPPSCSVYKIYAQCRVCLIADGQVHSVLSPASPRYAATGPPALPLSILIRPSSSLFFRLFFGGRLEPRGLLFSRFCQPCLPFPSFSLSHSSLHSEPRPANARPQSNVRDHVRRWGECVCAPLWILGQNYCA